MKSLKIKREKYADAYVNTTCGSFDSYNFVGFNDRDDKIFTLRCYKLYHFFSTIIEKCSEKHFHFAI